MRVLWIACLLVLSWTLVLCPSLRAEQPTTVTGLSPEVLDAYFDYAQVRHRLLKYRQVTRPQLRRQLAEESALIEEEIRILQRRVRDYRPFLAVGRVSPVQTAAENDRLALAATQQAARQLRDQRVYDLRFGPLVDQLYQLDLLRAVERVRAAQGTSSQ